MVTNCSEISYIFTYNTDFVTGSLFSNERVTNSETEKLNSISNVHNCGLISKENTCKISKHFVVYLCKFLPLSIFIAMMWKKKISYALKMLKDNVQSACRYLKQSKSSLYSSFCISIFIFESSTGMFHINHLSITDWDTWADYLSMTMECFPGVTQPWHKLPIIPQCLITWRRKKPAKKIREAQGDRLVGFNKGCSIISIKKTVVLILN